MQYGVLHSRNAGEENTSCGTRGLVKSGLARAIMGEITTKIITLRIGARRWCDILARGDLEIDKAGWAAELAKKRGTPRDAPRSFFSGASLPSSLPPFPLILGIHEQRLDSHPAHSLQIRRLEIHNDNRATPRSRARQALFSLLYSPYPLKRRRFHLAVAGIPERSRILEFIPLVV